MKHRAKIANVYQKGVIVEKKYFVSLFRETRIIYFRNMILGKLKIAFEKTAHRTINSSYDDCLAMKIKDKLKLKLN